MRQPNIGAAADDVRMRGFAQRHTVKAALAWLDAQLQPLSAEDVPLRIAAGLHRHSADRHRRFHAGPRL
jgi:hypothetical protein